MRIHRIRLKDVKGVRECDLEVPDSGVVVVEGPNEVGKSTVLEALDLLLDPRARATSRASRVRDLQPVGRDVGPCVEAELTLAGHRLRFGKQWLRQPRTELDVLTPAREVLAGDAAQERFDALVQQGLDRQLWDALRFLQSGGPLVGALGDSDALTRALDAAAGAELHSDQGDDLLSTVEAEYQRYFTPTGRPARELKQALHAAQHARDVAVDRHGAAQEAERLVDRHEEVVAGLAQAQARQQQLAAALDDAMARAARAEEALRALGQAETAERERAADAARAEREVDRRAAQAARVQRLVSAASAAEADRAQARQRLREQEPELTLARAAAEGARRDEERAAERVARAEALEEQVRDRKRWQEVTGTLRRDAEAAQELEGLRAEQAELQEQLRRLSGATAERCEQAKLAQHEVGVLEQQARHSAARWRLESLQPELPVMVDGETVTVTGAAPAERVLDRETVVEVPGSLRLVLHAGESERVRGEQVDRARARLSDLLQEAGAASVEALTEAVAERQRLTESLEAAGRRATELTSGPLLAEEQRERLGREATELRARLAGAPTEEPDPAVALEGARSARAEERRLRRACQEAETALAAVVQRRSQLEVALERATTVLEQCAVQRDQALAELAETRAGRDDEAVRAELVAAVESARVARAEAEQARRRVTETGAARAAGELDAAREALARHEYRLQELRGERDRLTGQLELVVGEGRQEQLELALADLEHARQELDAVARRARAVRRLRATLLRHRETAQQAYTRPYTAAVEALGREVYGDGFAVEVADDLRVVARVLDGVRVPVEQLSGGAQEQLGILCRLAVARLVDAAESAPVVLDDAFGFTDPDRLAQVVRVLGAASGDSQVILLTCVPDRMAGLQGATRVTLRPAS